MTVRDHERFEQDVGAYLLGALPELEAQAFERHLAGCEICQQDVQHLRVAAEALPRSVEPHDPPESLKRSLMDAVRADAAPAAPAPRRSRRARLRMPALRPELAWMAAAFVIALALASAAFYQLGQRADESGRTLAAEVDRSRVPDGGGRLVIPDEDGDAAVLEVSGMPRLERGRVFHVWLKRGDTLVPSSMFQVGGNGEGAAGIPGDLEGVDEVLVTREDGPARAPGEPPILSVKL